MRSVVRIANWDKEKKTDARRTGMVQPRVTRAPQTCSSYSLTHSPRPHCTPYTHGKRH